MAKNKSKLKSKAWQTKLDKHLVMILGIFLVSFALMLPLFLNEYHVGNDTMYHLTTISSIKELISTNFLSGITGKILPNIGNGFGYGSRLFYPPIFHTICAYLSYFLDNFNVSLTGSIKVFYLFTFFLSGVTMYICSYRFSKNKLLAFIASVIYLSSSYHLNEIYVRDAEAESILFIFLPLVILGVKELLEGNEKWFYPCFIIGYVGGILSHFTMMIYVTIFLAITLLCFYKKVFKKEFIVPFIKASVIVLLLTAFFFEPLFEHKFLGNYMVYKKWVMSLGIWHTTLWGIEYLLPVDYSGIYFYFSIVTLGLIGYVLIKKRSIFKEDKYKLIGIFTLISFIMSTRYSPWKIMPYSLFMIQFGWRLVTLVILGFALIGPEALKKSKLWVKGLCVIGILIPGFLSIHFATDNIANDLDYSFGLGYQREYMPVSLMDDDMEYYNNRSHNVINVDTKEEVEVVNNDFPSIEFNILNNGTYEMPRIFYYGYKLVDENNNSVNIKESSHGFLEANLSAGKYKLTFEGSTMYRVCSEISLITLLGIIIYSLKKLIEKEKKS